MWTTSESIGERMRVAGGRPSGFDYLRLTLAIAVFLIHVPLVNSGWSRANELWLSWARPAFVSVLPMFFAISGFLVAGSLNRCRTLFNFFWLRMLRILPALAGEVVLSAVILGPIFTTLSLTKYFSSPGFHHYFLNIVGDIHYYLPGVFASYPFPGVVNAQLWALPIELSCYILLAVIALLGIMRRPSLLICFVLLICVGGLVYDVIYSPERSFFFRIVIVESFLIGVACFALRDQIPVNVGVLLMCFGAIAVLPFTRYGGAVIAFPIVYVAVFLGLLNQRYFVLSGDYS